MPESSIRSRNRRGGPRTDRWAVERLIAHTGIVPMAGVDEVGLGPLAGPAVAAAVILPVGARLPGLNDSKQLTAAQRERLDRAIRRLAVAWAVAEVPPADVDLRGLTWARQTAMARAVEALAVAPRYLLLDAWDIPSVRLPQVAIIKGDSICASIMAASIVAKVHRDRLMVEMHRHYPGYGFDEHKGYATASHRAALRRLGPSPIHRMSWRPVRAALGLAGGIDVESELATELEITYSQPPAEPDHEAAGADLD